MKRTIIIVLAAPYVVGFLGVAALLYGMQMLPAGPEKTRWIAYSVTVLMWTAPLVFVTIPIAIVMASRDWRKNSGAEMTELNESVRQDWTDQSDPTDPIRAAP